MLAHTKKLHIEEHVTTLKARGPADKKEDAARLLKKIGFIITEDKKESLPWREAFPEISEDDSPAVCLRALRRRERLTQKELAEKADIPQSHLSMMESGKMQIGVQRARKLGKALNAGYKLFL
jgi:DNA-binding XRE family transcriptional regulator